MKLIYPAVFSPLEENSGFCVTFPDLPGCVTEGHSLCEAIENAEDAASGWVLDELEDGNPVPDASKLTDIPVGNGEFVDLIKLDMDSYAAKYGSNSIRKNCTIPSWLNTAAEKQHINFSKVLQDALMQRLNMSN
mgnify:CR=1 FL=1